jgi:hypothetical protein
VCKPDEFQISRFHWGFAPMRRNLGMESAAMRRNLEIGSAVMRRNLEIGSAVMRRNLESSY